jgi:hypothetical protein
MGHALATRLHCTRCGAEVLVTQEGSGVLRCCDTEMSTGSAGAAPAGGGQEEDTNAE